MRGVFGLVVAAAIGISGAVPEGQEPSAADNYFETSDGVRLHYLEAGDGDAVVFVPGWRMPAWIWEHQIDFFSSSHRVIALDPRGQGESEPATTGFYRERRAQDVEELLDAAGL